ADGVSRFIMTDDDVDFLVRKSEADWRLRAAAPDEVEAMLDFVQEMLVQRGAASVGISSREGNNRAGVGGPGGLVTWATRARRVLAYDTAAFLSVEHCRGTEGMEDFDVQLQLLRSGRPNCVLSYWANGQPQTQAPGGCAAWRTRETHERVAHRLKE